MIFVLSHYCPYVYNLLMHTYDQVSVQVFPFQPLLAHLFRQIISLLRGEEQYSSSTKDCMKLPTACTILEVIVMELLQ